MESQCTCEKVEEGLLTILKWVTQLEGGLVACATVTGLQVAAWLALAIWNVIMRSKKKSKQDMEDKMEEMKQKKWEENVTRMEGCLKARKKGRKEMRAAIKADNWNDQAWRRRYLLLNGNQALLNAHKAEAESKL